jgi:hypothetical protein
MSGLVAAVCSAGARFARMRRFRAGADASVVDPQTHVDDLRHPD